MNRNLLRYFSFVFAAFSLLSAFFSSLAIEQAWIRVALLICTIVLILFSAIFFLRAKKYDNALSTGQKLSNLSKRNLLEAIRKIA